MQSLIMNAMFSCLFVLVQMPNALMIVDHIVIKISYGAVNTVSYLEATKNCCILTLAAGKYITAP